MGAAVAAIAAFVAAAPAPCDEVVLRGGGRLSGVIVERTATRVSIETGPGRVTLPMSRVERIVDGRTALAGFAERAERLQPGDVEGWAALARWAEDRELLTQARSAWQRVLAVDPQHPEANAALGRVSLDGVWMSAEDAYRERGYVSYEGRWLTPAEHEAALREQAAEHAAALEEREADVRVREADARAREAEARAREAENAADQMDAGIPLGYAYGGYGLYAGYGVGYGGYGYGNGDAAHRHGRPGHSRPGDRRRWGTADTVQPLPGLQPTPGLQPVPGIQPTPRIQPVPVSQPVPAAQPSPRRPDNAGTRVPSTRTTQIN
jgi:hypothetical protein